MICLLDIVVAPKNQMIPVDIQKTWSKVEVKLLEVTLCCLLYISHAFAWNLAWWFALEKQPLLICRSNS